MIIIEKVFGGEEGKILKGFLSLSGISLEMEIKYKGEKLPVTIKYWDDIYDILYPIYNQMSKAELETVVGEKVYEIISEGK